MGYRAGVIRLRVASPLTHHPSAIPSPPLLLPSTTHIYDIPKVDMSLQKRARLTAPTDDMVGDMEERAPTIVEGLSHRVTDLSTTLARDTACDIRFDMQEAALKMPPKRTAATTTPAPMTDAQIKALKSQGVVDALVEIKVNSCSRNGYDSHGIRKLLAKDRVEPAREYGVLYSILAIATVRVQDQVCYHRILSGSALTWWNSHVKTVGHDAAYGMPWKTLKKMMTAKYCPRELATDVFENDSPVESDEVEKYVGGLPDMIQGSVVASKSKTMHDAIEFATEMMDQKIHSLADR
ncbi:hypothetical protein Tco_0736886 [Tanacetum coccineum]